MSAFNTASVRELTNARALDIALVDANGDQLETLSGPRPATAVLSAVAYAVGSQVAVPENPDRRRVIITNPTNKTVFLAFAPTASLTAYSFPLATGAVYDGTMDDYTGDIAVIWQSAPAGGQSLHVTEIS